MHNPTTRIRPTDSGGVFKALSRFAVSLYLHPVGWRGPVVGAGDGDRTHIISLEG